MRREIPFLPWVPLDEEGGEVTDFDSRVLRDAFGEFMTGVTVVTTLDAAGEPAGLTVNSFSSVSLDPPLLLFSLGKASNTFDAFEASNGFVVHVLAGDQQGLAERFASGEPDRFDGVEWTRGAGGLPVIADALARFECSREQTHEGGDHLIVVGRVQRVVVGDRTRPSLGYFRSQYTLQVGTPRDV